MTESKEDAAYGKIRSNIIMPKRFSVPNTEKRSAAASDQYPRSDEPNRTGAQFAAAETVARALALEADIVEVRVADDFERALEAARTKHVEAGILLSSPLAFQVSKQVGELAIAKRLPLVSLFREFPKVGGLIAYGPNVAEMFRRCGDYVGKILHGAKPSDLPIQRPEKFDLVINLKTAAALGVDIPTQLQQLADEVIE